MCPLILHAIFHFAGFILQPPFLEMAKYGLLWPKHGPHLVLKIEEKLLKIEETSSAQLRSAQIGSALIEYLIKLSSDSYLIKLVQQAQLSTD